jgi:hypothetical protein
LAIFFANFFASLSPVVSSFFFSVDFFAGSLSDAEVAGVLVPEGAADASVGTAELSESPSVPAIDSPFTKKP